jgi:hypothetical protein
MRTCLLGLAWLVVASVVAPGTASAKATASNQGFRTVTGGSEVYVVLRGSPGTPEVTKTKDGLQLVVPKTRMKGHRFLPLEPRYFATPVKSVNAFNRAGDLVLEIALKEQVEPKLAVSAKRGVMTVSLAFPPGEPDKTPPPLPKGAVARKDGEAGPAKVEVLEDEVDACKRSCSKFLAGDSPDTQGHDACNKRCEQGDKLARPARNMGAPPPPTPK